MPNLPRRNPYFTGRVEELDALDAHIQSHARSALTQAIGGMGGIGKTALVVEYLYSNYQKYTQLFWMDASSETALVSGFRQTAEELGLLPANAVLETPDLLRLMHRWMANDATGGWLLVMDNADFDIVPKGEDKALFYTPEKLQPFLPPRSAGKILLTTRTLNLTNQLGATAPLTLGVLTPPDALAFLHRAVNYHNYVWNDREKEAAVALAGELGSLPLALEQAAAYVQTEETTYADYLADFRKDASALLREQTPIHDGYPHTVLLTWRRNFEAVEKALPASADLLRLAAYLAPDNIDFDILTENATTLGPHLAAAFVEATTEDEQARVMGKLLLPLTRYGLAERKSDERVFHLHRMVQAATRDALPEAERKVWTDRAVEAMWSIWPGSRMETWPRCEYLLPHVLVCAEHIRREARQTESAGRVLNAAAYFLQDRARYAEAVPLYDEVLAIRRQELPEGHLTIAQSLNNLAGLYKVQGRYAEAEPLYNEALAIKRWVLPEGHPSIATTLNNLAELYRIQRRYAEGEPLFNEALAILERVLGQNHPNTKICRGNLELFRLERSKQRRGNRCTTRHWRYLNGY